MRNKLLTLILAVALCFSMSFVVACDSTPKISGSTVNVEVGQTAELFSAEEGVVLADVTVEIKNQTIATWTTGTKEVKGVAQGLTAADITYGDTTITVYVNVIDNSELNALKASLTEKTTALESALAQQKTELTTAINNAKTALENTIAGLEIANIGGLTDKLATLQTKADAAASITEVKGLVTELTNTVNNINNTLTQKIADEKAALQANIDAANASIANLKTQLENADIALKNELNGKISDLQTQITANATAIAALQTADTNLQNQITELNSALTTLTERVATAESKISALEASIDELENDINEMVSSKADDAALADAKLAAKIEILSAVYEKGLLTYDFSTIDAATTVDEIATAKAAILEDLADANELIKAAKVDAASDIIVYYEKNLAGTVAAYEHASKTAVQLAISKEREVAFVKILFADTIAEIDEITEEFKETCDKIIEDYTAMDLFAEMVENFYFECRTNGITASENESIAMIKQAYEDLSDEAKELLDGVEIKVYFADVDETADAGSDSEGIEVIATAVTPAEEQPEDVLVLDAYAKIFDIQKIVELIAQHYVAGDEVTGTDKELYVGGRDFTIGEGDAAENVTIVIDKYLAERRDDLQKIADQFEALGLYQYYMKGDMANTADKTKDGAKAHDIVDLLNSETYANEFIAKFVAAVIPEDATETTYNAYITALYATKIQSSTSRAWKYVKEHAPQVATFWNFYTKIVGAFDGSAADATVQTVLTAIEADALVPAAPAADADEVAKLYWEELKKAYLDTAEAALASAKSVYAYGTKTVAGYGVEGVAVDQVYDDRTAAVIGATSAKDVYNTVKADVVAADYFAAAVETNYGNMITNYEIAYGTAAAFINCLISEVNFGGEAGVFTSERTAFKTVLDTVYANLSDFAKLYVIDLPKAAYDVYTGLVNTEIVSTLSADTALQALLNTWSADAAAPNEKLYNDTYNAATATKLIKTYIKTAGAVNANLVKIQGFATSTNVKASNRYAAMSSYNDYVGLIAERVASDYVTAENNGKAATVKQHFDTDYQAALKFYTAFVNHSFDAYTTTTGEGDEAVTAPTYATFGDGFKQETAKLSAFAANYLDGYDMSGSVGGGSYALLVTYQIFAYDVTTSELTIAGQITANVLDYINSLTSSYASVGAFVTALNTTVANYDNVVFGTIEGETFTPTFDADTLAQVAKYYVDSIQTTYNFAAALYNGAASLESADALATNLATLYALVDGQTIKAEYLNNTYANVYADYLALLGNITADEDAEDGISVPTIHTYATVEVWMSDYVGNGLVLAKDLASKVAKGAAGQACVDAYEALIAEAPLAYYYLSEELRNEYLRIAKEKMTNDAINMIALYVANYSKLSNTDKADASKVAPIASTINTWFKILDQYAKEDTDLSAAMAERINTAAATAGFPTAGTKVLDTTYTSAYAAARALVAIPDAYAETMVDLLDTFNATLEEFHNKPNTSTYFTVTSGADLDKWTDDSTKGLQKIYNDIAKIQSDLAYFNSIKGIADYNYGEVKLADAITAANSALTNVYAKIDEMQAAIANVIDIYTVANVKSNITTIAGYVYETNYNDALNAFKVACEALKTTVHTASDKAYNYDWTKDSAISANRTAVETLCREIDELISAITSMNTAYFEAIPSGLSVTTTPEAYKALTTAERETLQASIKEALKNDCHIEDPKTVAAIISRMILTDEEMINAINTNVALLAANYAYIVANNAAIQAKIDAVKNDNADKALVDAWLASYGELATDAPAATKAEALRKAYGLLGNNNNGTLKTEKQSARIKEQALALQNEVANATKALLDAKDAIAAAEDADAIAAAEAAYAAAKAAYGYSYTDGETTVWVFSVVNGGNAYPMIFEFTGTKVVSNISTAE